MPATMTLGLEPASQPASVGEEPAGSPQTTTRENELPQPPLHGEVELIAIGLASTHEGGVVLSYEFLGMSLERHACGTLEAAGAEGKAGGKPAGEAVGHRT